MPINHNLASLSTTLALILTCHQNYSLQMQMSLLPSHQISHFTHCDCIVI